MKTVSVEGLAEALVQVFTDYTEEVEDLVAKEVEETAKITQAEIKANSPVRKGPKGGGYKKGWSRRKSSKGGHTVYTIYNKDKPGLVHLLEKGWTTRKGNRVSGRPHVKPAYEKHVKTMPDRIKKLIESKRGG